LHTKFTASSERATVLSFRKLGEVSNIIRRNLEIAIILRDSRRALEGEHLSLGSSVRGI
jgi:hypothetical protein